MLVRVASYLTPIEAHLAHGRLEAEGIAGFVCHHHHVGLNWSLARALGGVKVYVHRDDADRALDVIAAHDRGDYALDEDEPVRCMKCNSDDIVKGRTSWKGALVVTHLASIPLYFRWATCRCKACGHESDLPSTSAYSGLVIALAAIPISVIVALLFSIYCIGGTKFWLIFPLRGFCG